MVDLRQVDLPDFGACRPQTFIQIADLGNGERSAEAEDGSAFGQLLFGKISSLRHEAMIGAFFAA